MATGESSSGLGPSVDVTYEVLNKTFHEVDNYFFFEENYTGGSKDYFYFSDAYTMMLANDTTAWNLHWRGTNATELDFDVYFHFPSPYEAVDNLYLTGRIRCYDTDTLSYFVGDACTLVIFIADSSGSDSATLSSVDVDASSWNVTTIALDADNVVDGYIHGRIAVDVRDNDATLDVLNIDLDYFAFDYTDVEETRRSQYSVQGGTLKYTVDFTTWDYNVNTTLSTPSDWTFKDVNPDCAQTNNEFEALVPEDYEAVYTMDVLATANWELGFADSFEHGFTQWTLTGAGATRALQYVTVLDGGASTRVTGDGVEDMEYGGLGSTYGAVWVFYNLYIEAGDAKIYVRDSGGWNTQVVTTTDEWVSGFIYTTDLTDDTTRDRNIILRTGQAAGGTDTVCWDNIMIVESSVSGLTSGTLTGTLNHLHPNGYTPAGTVTFEYYCSTWFATWTEHLTATDGTWSLSTSGWSLAAGTETFQTRNPDDTTNDVTSDSITYPWTTQDEVTMHFSYYMADGTAMLFNTFKTYIDSERVPGETPWVTTTAVTVNLTITDVWNDTVYQDTTLDVAEFVDIVTTSYWFIFTNQRDYSVNVTIEHNSHNVTMGDPIGPGEGFSRIFYTGDYTIYCWRSETGELEEGFPKDGTVADRWEVYTEKSTGSPSGPGGLTLIDLTFTVLKSVGVAMFVLAIAVLLVWKVIWPRIKGED